MSFINKWIDKVDGVDDVLADDVNLLATGIKEAIEKAEETVTFDGIIETDEIDEYEFPQKSGSYVYKLIDSLLPDDFGGILLVASHYNKRGSITYLAKMYQTKIIVSTGEILTRQTTHTTHIQPITWSEWESRYISSIPVADNAGTAGIVKLGKLNGLIITNDMLVVDSATTAEIQTKSSTRKPIVPTRVAYALAMNTHQSLDDSYNPDNFQVVHSAKNEAIYFPTNKDKLPVSYAAVKKAMPYKVDENNNAQFKSGISGGSVCSDYFETVGSIYNNSFCVNLSRALYLEIYSGEPTVIFNTSKYVRVTIAGITVTIPSNKFEYYGTNTDNNLYWYKGFINDYPQFADYVEEMPDGDVAVASATSCYKIDSDGAAEFTSLAVPHMYLTSPDNSIYKVTVNNNGDLETTKVTFDENGNEIIVPPDIEFE